MEFPDDGDYDTLAGFLIESVGAVPQTGDFVAYNNYQFTIVRAEETKVIEVKIEKIIKDGEPESSDDKDKQVSV